MLGFRLNFNRELETHHFADHKRKLPGNQTSSVWLSNDDNQPLLAARNSLAKKEEKIMQFLFVHGKNSLGIASESRAARRRNISNSVESENSQQLLAASKGRRKSKKQKNIVFWESRIKFYGSIMLLLFCLLIMIGERDRVIELASRSVRKEVYRKLANLDRVLHSFSARLLLNLKLRLKRFRRVASIKLFAYSFTVTFHCFLLDRSRLKSIHVLMSVVVTA